MASYNYRHGWAIPTENVCLTLLLWSAILNFILQWWDRTGKHMKTMYLKGSFGKYIRYSPDFCTFVTIDNVGLLYILDTII